MQNNVICRFPKMVMAAFAAVALSACSRDSEIALRPMPDLLGGVEIGRSVENRPIHKLEMGTGEEVVLIIATIHGNENAGTPMMHHLREELIAHPEMLEGRKVVIIPVINPDGYAKNIRTNANGVDLNRNFPASNRVNSHRYGTSPLSEPESRLMKQLLDEYKPARIVVTHQPLDCVDWDGPAEDLSRHMARYCNLPSRRIGARPGSLGSHAGVDLKIPIITYEMPRDAEKASSREIWLRWGPALMAAITFPEAPPAPSGLTQEANGALVGGLAMLTLVGVAGLVIGGRRREE